MAGNPDDIFKKFVVRRIRATGKPYRYDEQWQVAFPGSPDKPMQSKRTKSWEEAMSIALYGVNYIERRGWDVFKVRVLKDDQ